MTHRRLIVPLATCLLAVALAVAVVLARSEKPSRALSEATLGILQSTGGTPPEIAALNAQLEQVAELHAEAVFGTGFKRVTSSPVTALRATLGEEWHELRGSGGVALLRPRGVPSAYFELGMVAVNHGPPSQLTVLTNSGERIVQQVTGKPFQVINIGPLITPRKAPIEFRLSSSASPLVLSPFQTGYLAAGEAVMSMPALSEVGPAGIRGVFLPAGSTTRFAITPGVHGECTVGITGFSVGGGLQVSVGVGPSSHRALLGSRTIQVRAGPFAAAADVVSVHVEGSRGAGGGGLFLHRLRLIRVAVGGQP